MVAGGWSIYRPKFKIGHPYGEGGMSWGYCWQVTIIEIGLKLGKKAPRERGDIVGSQSQSQSPSHQKPRLGYLSQLANTQVLCNEMFLDKTPEASSLSRNTS